VYLWWIHVDIWQNQYNIVNLKNKIKLNKNKESLKSFPSHNLARELLFEFKLDRLWVPGAIRGLQMHRNSLELASLE